MTDLRALRERLANRRGKAAQFVTWYDWSGNDSDAVAAVDKLRTLVDAEPAPDK